MNGFDILTVVVVTFCLIRGVFKGLVGEVSGIIGVIAAFYGAYTYYPMLTGYAAKWISSIQIAKLLSFFLIFCGIMVAVSLISFVIRKILKLVFLGWVDRTFGLIFGALKGILIVSVILVMATSFLPKDSPVIVNSQLAPHVVHVSESLSLFVSQKGRSDFLKQLRGVL